jgi:hypothetical protein
MKIQPLIASLLAAACLAPAALRAASPLDAEAAVTRKIYDEHKDSVIWISAVAKITFTSSESAGMAIPEREQKLDTLGTIIDANGMVVAALSTLDPTKLISGREVATRNGKITLDASVIVKEIKLIMPDGTEIPADMVMKDYDLDLAFIRPKADAKELKGVTFTPVNLKDNAPGEIADIVVTLARADEILNRQPQVSLGQIVTVTTKPRRFLRVDNAHPGSACFSQDGKLLGIGVTRINKEKSAVAVILPATDVLEIAEQAKSAKPIVVEEKPKPAATGDKGDKADKPAAATEPK